MSNPTIRRLLAQTAERKAEGLIPDYSRPRRGGAKRPAPHASGAVPHHTSRKAAGGMLPCVHRGEATGATEVCGSCRGRVSLKVFDCTVHTQGCTIARPVPGRACCQNCPDFARPANRNTRR